MQRLRAFLQCCSCGSRGVQERWGAVWYPREESWTLVSPQTAQKQKDVILRDLKAVSLQPRDVVCG